MAHPQENGQVEAVNKIIKSTIKKQLEKAKGGWVDKLPLALWAYRTTHKTATGHTPFSLAYGSEAMIPVEIEVPSQGKFIPIKTKTKDCNLKHSTYLMKEEKKLGSELQHISKE